MTSCLMPPPRPSRPQCAAQGAVRRATHLAATAAVVALAAFGCGAAFAVTCAPGLTASNPDSAYTTQTLSAIAVVTDSRSGLMWKRDVEPGTFTWAGALARAEAATDAGFMDWRLPNLKELRSLVEECRVNPTINDTVFPATAPSNVWSGSPYAGNSSNAWYVNFNGGNAGNNGVRSFANSVRLVRGGQSFGNLVNGACGAANGVASTTAPTANLCSAGTPSNVVTGATTYTWTCAGQSGGTTESCSAPNTPISWAVKMLSETHATPTGQVVAGGPLGENNWGPFEPVVGATASVADVQNGEQFGSAYYGYTKNNELLVCSNFLANATCSYADVATHLLYSPEDALPDTFTGSPVVQAGGRPLGTRTPIVLVHGWQGGALSCISPFARDCSVIPAAMLNPTRFDAPDTTLAHVYWKTWLAFFREQGLADQYKVYVYKYPSYKHMTFNGRMLKELVAANAELTGRNDLTFISHSMGTIVTRSAFEEHGLPHTRMGKMVSLNGVHHGSPAAIPGFVPTNTVPKNLATLGANDIQWDFYDGLNVTDRTINGAQLARRVHADLGGNDRGSFWLREMASSADVDQLLSRGTYSGAGLSVEGTATTFSTAFVGLPTYTDSDSGVGEFEVREYENTQNRLGKTRAFDSHFRSLIDARPNQSLPIFAATRGSSFAVTPITNVARTVAMSNIGGASGLVARPVVQNPWLLHLNMLHQTMPSAYKEKIHLYAGIYFNEDVDRNAVQTAGYDQSELATQAVEALGVNMSTTVRERTSYGYLNDGPVPTTSALLDLRYSFGDVLTLSDGRNPFDLFAARNSSLQSVADSLKGVTTMYPGRVADAILGINTLGVARIDPPGQCGQATLQTDVWNSYAGDGCVKHRVLGGYGHDMVVNGCYPGGSDTELTSPTTRSIWSADSCWRNDPRSPSGGVRATYVAQALGSRSSSVPDADKLRWEPVMLSVLNDISASNPVAPWLNAIPAPSVTVSPAAFDYGVQRLGTSSNAVITVKNESAAPISGLALSVGAGSVFSTSSTSCGSSLGAGASCTMTVGFRPSVAGVTAESVRVTYGSFSKPVLLRGTGIAAVTRTATAPASKPNTQISLSAVDAAGNVATSGCSIETMRSLGYSEQTVTNAAATPAAAPASWKFPWGMVEFKLSDCVLGASQSVKIDLPEPLPTGVQWAYWKATSNLNWNTLGSAQLPVPVTISADRRSVTFTITDGGPGDADGVVNGRIVDPGAIGYEDRVPDVISFGAPLEVSASSVVDSPTVAVTGINATTTISVIGGTFAVSIDGGRTWSAQTGTSTSISAGTLVRVRHTSAAQPGGRTETTLNLLGQQATFVSVVAGQANCTLDFNGDGLIGQDDALLFNRWLLGFRGNALVAGITPYPLNRAASFFAADVANRLARNAGHDLDGDNAVRASTDGVLFARLARQLTGTAVTQGAVNGNVRSTFDAIRTYANTQCGASLAAAPAASPQPSLSIDTDATSLTALGAVLPATTAYSFITGNAGRSAVKFNGMANPGAIRIPNTAAMQFTTGATIDLWARIDSGTGMSGANGQAATSGWAMALVAKSHDSGSASLNAFANDANSAGSGYGFGAWASSVPGWGTGTCTIVTRNPGAALGTWFRLTAVASTTAGTRIYHNKQLVYSCPSAVPSFTGMNGQDLYIGKYRDAWYPLNGAVQDIRIYQQALTDAQVQALP